MTGPSRIGIGLDFNPTCFSHPKAADGFTLSHPDKAIRKFWIEHCQLSREIGAAMGKALGTPAVTNVWIPDGMKDTPADRRGPRERLAAALDEVFKKPLDPKHNLDAVEGKLFGIGAKATPWACTSFISATRSRTRSSSASTPAIFIRPKTWRTRFRPCSVSCRKSCCTSAAASAGTATTWSFWTTRCWPSRRNWCAAIISAARTSGWIIFDASINRIAAWTIGARNMLRALCIAMLDPIDKLKKLELAGDYTSRLALMEEAKTLPFAAVWDYYCLKQGAPVGEDWLAEVKKYEKDVLSKRK